MTGAARTLAHLANQTIAQSLEVVVVSTEPTPLPSLLSSSFGSMKHVQMKSIDERGVAAFHGLRTTTADIIALVEDHAFPDPNWAECLLACHRSGDWVGVGSKVLNANPASASSWTNHVLHYGKFSAAAVEGCLDLIPWHNSAYKRSALAPLWDQLGILLTWEGWLQDKLQTRGGRLYLLTNTATHHTNVSTVYDTLAQSFAQGRAIAATRTAAGKWPLTRRVLYAVAAPATLGPEWVRALRSCAAVGVPNSLMRQVSALLFATIAAAALGRLVGYLRGAGRAFAMLEEYDLHRRRYLNKADTEEERASSFRIKAQWHNTQEASA